MVTQQGPCPTRASAHTMGSLESTNSTVTDGPICAACVRYGASRGAKQIDGDGRQAGSGQARPRCHPTGGEPNDAEYLRARRQLDGEIGRRYGAPLSRR